MENSTPISIKHLLIVSKINEDEKKQELELLLKQTSPDLIINLNNEYEIKTNIPQYSNLKNKYLNFDNQITIFNYECQNNLPKKLLKNKFSICLAKDLTLNNDKWDWELNFPTHICIIDDDKLSELITEKNIFDFKEEDVTFLIANQNLNFKQLFYIFLRIEFYDDKIESHICHSHQWMFDFFKNE